MSESKQNLRENLLDSMSADAVETKCVQCGVAEWVIPLDAPIDASWLANYHCADCD